MKDNGMNLSGIGSGRWTAFVLGGALAFAMAARADTPLPQFSAMQTLSHTDLNAIVDRVNVATAPGTVLQVVTKTFGADFGPGGNGVYGGDVATITITPRSPTSKMLVTFSSTLHLYWNGPDPHNRGYVGLFNGGAKIGATQFGVNNQLSGNEGDKVTPIVVRGEWSTDSGNPITFSVRMKQRANATTAIVVNADPDEDGINGAYGLLEVAEIAQ